MTGLIKRIALSLTFAAGLGLLVPTTGCVIRTSPSSRRHHSRVKHPQKHRHTHCHHKKRGKRVCHSHPHRHPHH